MSSSLRDSPWTYFAAGAASMGLCFLVLSSLSSSQPKPKIIKSPLSKHESKANGLPYPPAGFLPGARDVDTPYGSIRVYEVGPEDATRKVLLVHGISTPSVALAGIAEGLVKRGCRVMTFDLFGRGWSDLPGELLCDNRLYTTQILMALASSPLSWTGAGSGGKGFSIVGYSLGGGIVADFTSFFPELIEDLVLLAPAGIIRPTHRDVKTKVLYSGVLPEKIVQRVVSKRLVAKPNVRTIPAGGQEEREADVSSAEVANVTSLPSAFGHPLDPQAVVKWQIDAHEGFVASFISSIRFAPVSGQHDRWSLIGKRLTAQRAAKTIGKYVEKTARLGLGCGKVLMVVGKTDSAVFTPELEVDALEVLGKENLEILSIEAGHEVPITHSQEIVDWIWTHWTAEQ